MLYATVLAGQRWDHMNWGGGAWIGARIVMLIFMLLLIALLILAIVWLVRSLQSGPGGGRRTEPTALELLDRRLAEGTISVEEYEQRRRILEGRPEPGGS